MILNAHKIVSNKTGLRLILKYLTSSCDDSSEDFASNTIFPIVWTFDDCHIDMLDIAKIFNDFNLIKFRFFVSPLLIDQYHNGNQKFVYEKLQDSTAALMSWDQIAHLVESGHYIGLHGYDHSDFNNMSNDEIKFQHEASRELLIKRLGICTDSFAFPFGRVDSDNINRKRIISLAANYYSRIYLSDNRFSPSSAGNIFNRRHSEFDKSVIMSLAKGYFQKLSLPSV
jgi:peptidoglycan/xylan/chitin deacetylase (PgdA/CDA1 family)